MDEITLTGRESLLLMSRLLDRVRLADDGLCFWEAADVQWWSRRPVFEGVEQHFWVDTDGEPAAAVWRTHWKQGTQADPVVVPGTGLQATVLTRLLDLAEPGTEVPVDDADAELRAAVEAAGLTADETDSTAWLTAATPRPPKPLADGFTVASTADRPGTDHPMIARNGPDIAAHLASLPLYDASLDLRIEAPDGASAGYALFWHNPVTRVGLVEPVRVEDDYQRLGLASALVSTGVEMLLERGCERVKISYGTPAAGAVYEGVGFVTGSTATWWVVPGA